MRMAKHGEIGMRSQEIRGGGSDAGPRLLLLFLNETVDFEPVGASAVA